MAHALEVRAPFLDPALGEYALRLPGRLKIRGATTKRVLKEAVADLLPAEIRNRRKHGFGVPVDAWFRGDLGRYLESQLLTDASRISQHLSPGPIRRMVTEHAAGRANHGQGLWTLLTLEVFLRSQGW